MVKNVRIGEVLKEKGYITEEQIGQALEYQKTHKGQRLGQILISLNYVSEEQVLQALSERLNVQVIDIFEQDVDITAVELIPQHLAEKYLMIAIKKDDARIQVVVNDPLDFYAQEDIRQLTGLALDVYLCNRETILKAIDFYYSEVHSRMAAKDANMAALPEIEEFDVSQGEDSDAPIIKLLNSLVQRGYATGASDIHIEPFETYTLVRMRIDGILVEHVTLQKSVHPSLIARIKIVSNLDIAEKRIPQDGHFKTKIGEETVNIRVSVIPTVFGEKAVLRLLSSQASIDHSSHFGMDEESFDKFKRMMSSPNGIIYITGPTGSGKSTTLYMALESVVQRPVNISTIEDPVEKNIKGISQVQVNPIAGLTFESGLRSLLRQDPDIIMVGETRDSETANISVRAAITGHLVFSTLHTNSAVGSIVRLIDMGLESYMVANSLVGIVAQRLMRKICPECGKWEPTTEEERLLLGEDVEQIRRPKGCQKCNHTGYRGRVAIHEVLMIDSHIRSMITNGSTMEEIEQYAVEHQHMRTLKNSGVKLVREGITSLDELHKVAYYSE